MVNTTTLFLLLTILDLLPTYAQQSSWSHPRQEPIFQKDGAQLTFDAETNHDPDSSKFSRRPHWPGTDQAGVTIGCCYDLSSSARNPQNHRHRKRILKDLQRAGLSEKQGNLLTRSTKMKGKRSEKFLKDKAEDLEGIELTSEGEKILFEITYNEIVAELQRVSDLETNVDMYGAVDFDKVDRVILDVMVDLKYRGEYTPKTRRKVQKAFADNDLEGIVDTMSNHDFWVLARGVSEDRFQRRLDYVTNALRQDEKARQRRVLNALTTNSTETNTSRGIVSVEQNFEGIQVVGVESASQ